jgi:hypothetical protein
LGAGYRDVFYYRGYPHTSVRGELQYESPTGKKSVVWPVLHDAAVAGDTAIFTGYLHSGSAGSELRVFGFQPPGPAVDITDQIIAVAAKDKGESVAQVSKKAIIGSVKNVDGMAELRIAYLDYTDSKITLGRDQILNLMHEVQESAISRQDQAWGTPYLQKEIAPATKK